MKPLNMRLEDAERLLEMDPAKVREYQILMWPVKIRAVEAVNRARREALGRLLQDVHPPAN